MDIEAKHRREESTGLETGRRALAVVTAAALLMPNVQPAFAENASDVGAADGPEFDHRAEVDAARAELVAAQAALEAAQNDADAKQAAYHAAMQQAEQANNMQTSAQQTRDAAKTEADEKAAIAADAQKDYDAKQKAYQDAESAYENAAATEADANKTLADAKATFDAAQEDLISKQEALNAANQTLKSLQDQKDRGAAENKGAYDFFVSIGDQSAADILTNAEYASETHPGEKDDASCTDNVRCVFQFIEECNAIRESLGLDELKVTSEMMACAISDCNWSDTTFDHANQFNVGENLAWGYGKQPYQLDGYSLFIARSNPFYGWYDKEKARYDAAVAGGNYPGLADMSASEVAQTYPKLYQKAEHYLNIVNPAYTVTGFAWNNINSTFCQVFDASTEAQSYSVGEYKGMYEQWCATLTDPDIDSKIEAAQTAAEKAQAEYDEALSEFQKTLSESDTAETARNKARAEAKAARKAKEAAEQALPAARDALNAALASSNNAAAAYAEAQQTYESAKADFATAEAACQQAHEAYTSAVADVALAQANYDVLKAEAKKTEKPDGSDASKSEQQVAEKQQPIDQQQPADQQSTDKQSVDQQPADQQRSADQAESSTGKAHQLAQTGDSAGAHAAAATGVAAAGALGAIALRRKLKSARHAR